MARDPARVPGSRRRPAGSRKTGSADRAAASGAADARYMRMALLEARRGEARDEVPVGAVVVKQGQVIARAHNRPRGLTDPSAHAEVLALRRAAKRLANYRLSGCDLYVTIEPCAMCAGAMVHARIARLIYGSPDRKAGACGSALRVLNHRRLNHRVKVTRGVLSAEAGALLQQFFARRRSSSASTLT